jgi:hypothetical protein
VANVILKTLVKRFGSVTAVDHLSIEIRNREEHDPTTGSDSGNTLTVKADVVDTLGFEIFAGVNRGCPRQP